VALSNFDSTDVQSVYYDCKNYAANLFRFEDKIFFRSLFLFDESIEDFYSENPCTTFDAVYENLPIVDTLTCPVEDRKRCGLMIDTSGASFEVKKEAEGVLKVSFGDKSVTFYDDRIEVVSDSLLWYNNATVANTEFDNNGIAFEYKGHPYRLNMEGQPL